MKLMNAASLALVAAGCARAFVLPGAVPGNSFVQPTRAALSSFATPPAASTSSAPQMKIAIVTVSSGALGTFVGRYILRIQDT